MSVQWCSVSCEDASLFELQPLTIYLHRKMPQKAIERIMNKSRFFTISFGYFRHPLLPYCSSFRKNKDCKQHTIRDSLASTAFISLLLVAQKNQPTSTDHFHYEVTSSFPSKALHTVSLKATLSFTSNIPSSSTAVMILKASCS